MRWKFIEVKGPKGRLSEIQKYRIEELKEKGFDVKVMKPCWIVVDKYVYNIGIDTTPSNDLNWHNHEFRHELRSVAARFLKLIKKLAKFFKKKESLNIKKIGKTRQNKMF